MLLFLLLSLNLFLIYQILSLKKMIKGLLTREKNEHTHLEKLFSHFRASLENATREQNYLFCKFLDDKLCDFEKQMRQKESLQITEGYENPLESE